MDAYVTGQTIRLLRESKGITQAALAQMIGVTDKAISKWETGKGLPDVTLVEPLAAALQVSVMELMKGQPILNRNPGGNLLRTRFYVCPLCGNVIHSVGEAAISCCGIALPPLEAEEAEGEHSLQIENVEDEYFVSIDHPMTKQHFISFMALVNWERVQLVKLYPESDPQTRFPRRCKGTLYYCCNHHGLFKKRL
ncbi:MAG: helix-turn-helix domain-containing protein [Clostridiales bacterium]|nr:helix-turn-helix domain-containing protein [Clostridiales bacterium]